MYHRATVIMESHNDKRKHITFSISQKQEVIKYQDDNLKASWSVANHFSVVWRCQVKRRTVGDILQNRDKWLARDCEPGAKKLKTAKYSDLEEVPFLITDDILREKAREFGEEFNINDFTYSSGWLYRFKKRHVIASHTLCGESAGVDKQLISDGVERAVTAMQDYSLKDIYNMDETGLFFRLLPDKSLSTSDHTKGTKKSKEKLTVVLTCNADRSDKLRPSHQQIQKTKMFQELQPQTVCGLCI